MSAFVTFVSDKKVYILTSGDSIRGFETVQEALDYFEQGYKRSHDRGYESSMSACLNFISFQPAVHELNEEDLTSLVKNNVIVLEDFRKYSLSNVSGRMEGALCTGEKAMEFHESGITPSLI